MACGSREQSRIAAGRRGPWALPGVAKYGDGGRKKPSTAGACSQFLALNIHPEITVKKNSYGMYAIALAIVVVGALAFGVSARSLGFLGFVLVCPLMMFVMMRGMGGMGTGQNENDPRRRQDEAEHRDDSLPK